MSNTFRQNPVALKRIALLVACAATVGCASAAPASRSSSSRSGIGVQSANFLPMPDLQSSLMRLPPPLRAPVRRAGGTSVGGDRSVGAEGLLGHTTNEVVPIPGTDMIRVGFLQEGTFSSSQFRSGAQEAKDRGGAPGAGLIFKISRP